MFAYKNLDVYKLAFSINNGTYQYLKRSNLLHYIKNQLGRACLSIQLNIAEGSGKFTNKDRKNFYITASASAFECASIIELLQNENEMDENLSKKFQDGYERISKMLFVMIRTLDEVKTSD